MITQILAERLMNLLEDRDMTQKELAEKRKKKGTKKEQKSRIMCYNIIVQSCNLLWTA